MTTSHSRNPELIYTDEYLSDCEAVTYLYSRHLKHSPIKRFQLLNGGSNGRYPPCRPFPGPNSPIPTPGSFTDTNAASQAVCWP